MTIHERDWSSYKIYSKASYPSLLNNNENLALLYGVKEYVYPQDGSFDLAGCEDISLVLIK